MRILLALFLIGFSWASFTMERLYPGDWANWNHVAGALLLLEYLRQLFKHQRIVLLGAAFQVYSWLGMLISAAIIADGTFMIEVTQYGTQNGIFWIVLAYFVAGMEMTVLGYCAASRVRTGVDVQHFPAWVDRWVIFAICGVALSLSALVFFLYGSPLLTGIGRVLFWRTKVPSQLSFVPNLVIQSFALAACYYLLRRRDGKRLMLPSLIVLGYLLATALVLGQKLSAFIVFISVWLLLTASIYPQFKLRKVHILIGLAGAASLLVLIMTWYVIAGRGAGFVVGRAALQAQLLWVIFSDTIPQNVLPQDWRCFLACDGYASGRDFITYISIPLGRYNNYLATNTTLSGFVPALSIITLGPILAFLLHLSFSFILGFMQRKIRKAFQRGNMLYGLLAFKLHFNLTILSVTASLAPVGGIVVVLLLIALYHVFLQRTDTKVTRPAWLA